MTTNLLIRIDKHFLVEKNKSIITLWLDEVTVLFCSTSEGSDG